ncbi:MAG: GNAT family N-acetyltransferase [Anaerolineae bacterium]|nr:GNAT family N-acetyltransferase [Anaerolineae bacterium]
MKSSHERWSRWGTEAAVFNSRFYADDDDLHALQALARLHLSARPASAFHPGDLAWWAYYNPWDSTQESVYLWRGLRDVTLGGVFCVPFHGEYDLIVHPGASSEIIDAMIQWSENFMLARLRADPSLRNHVSRLSSPVFEQHESLNRAFAAHGYEPEDHLVVFGRTLDEPLPPPRLPPGYHFLEVMQPHWAERRAKLHAQAFAPSRMNEAHYLHLMSAPCYHPALDIVIVAPDGTFASFALAWADEELRTGEFEPVGTHPSHRRLGLGHAALREGLRRLRALGMEQATLCCDATHVGNLTFYQGLGFTEQSRVRLWTRPCEQE